MPYKRKDSRYWWADFTDTSGKRVRCPTGTTDRKEAEALEAKWKLEAYRARQWDEQPSRSFEELMVTYLREALGEKRGAERDYRIVKILRSHFDGVCMNAIRANNVRDYAARRRENGVKASTINRELSVLSAAINYANREWEWGLPNPVAGRKLKQPEARVRWISRSEAEALIWTASVEPKAPHLPDFIRLALHTGCRRGELLGLEWSRVDLTRRLLYLEGTHTKSGKRRSVPLNETAREALVNRARFRAKYCPATPWVFCNREGTRLCSVKKSFATACKRVGISDFRVHDMRHNSDFWIMPSALMRSGGALALRLIGLGIITDCSGKPEVSHPV